MYDEDTKGVMVAEQRHFYDCTARARTWRSINLSTIPGIVQTGAYMRAVTAKLSYRTAPTWAEAENSWQARMAIVPTKRELFVGEFALENVLSAPIHQSAVMREQLRHLAALIQGETDVPEGRPCNVVRIMPRAAKLALCGPSTVLLNEGMTEETVFVEALGSMGQVSSPTMIAESKARLDAIAAAALPRQDSLERITEVMEELG